MDASWLKNLNIEQAFDKVGASLVQSFEEFPDGDAKAQGWWKEFNLSGQRSSILECVRAVESHRSDQPTTDACEVAERKLVQLARRLLEAPDPNVLLSSGATAELDELRQENLALKRAAEDAKRDDQEVLQLVAKLESSGAEQKRLQDKVEELDRQLLAQRQAAEAAEARALQAGASHAGVAELEAKVQELNAALDKAQARLFEANAREEQQGLARQVEVEMAAEENDRLQKLVDTLQHEKYVLASRLAQAGAGEMDGAQQRAGELQRLRTALEQQERELSAARAEHQAVAETQAAQAAELQQSLEAAMRELAGRPAAAEFDRLRQKVAVLESLLEPQTSAEINSALESQGHVAVLHQALQKRLKSASARNTALAAQLEEAHRQREEAQRDSARLEERCRVQDALISQLEGDLVAVGRDVVGTAAESADSSDIERERQTSSSLADAPAGADDSSRMLAIVTAQRDRFRERLQAAHGETAAARDQLAAAQARVGKLEAEAVGLYEKIRYLESYSNEARARLAGSKRVLHVDSAGVDVSREVAGRYQCGPFALNLSLDADVGGDSRRPGMRARGGAGAMACFGGDEELGQPQAVPVGSSEAEYVSRYADQINPFKRFQKREELTSERRLMMHERAALTTSRMLLGSGIARLLFALYLLLMHMFLLALVFYAMQ